MTIKRNDTLELRSNAESSWTNTTNMNLDNVSVLAIAFQCLNVAKKS